MQWYLTNPKPLQIGLVKIYPDSNFSWGSAEYEGIVTEKIVIFNKDTGFRMEYHALQLTNLFKSEIIVLFSLNRLLSLLNFL